MGGSDGCVSQKYILELVVAGRQDRSALVDLSRIEQVQDRKMLHGQDPVHALEAKTALAIQEVRDMSLLESSLLCQTEAGQIAFINALPKSFAQVILQHSEFHSWEYSMGYSNSLINKRFPQPLW